MNRLFALPLAFVLSLAAVPSFAAGSAFANADKPKYNLDAEGVALGGYDPVAYHSENRAVPGLPEHTASADGARFRFATAANRATFEANPEKYLPAYGGWCAYGVGMEAKGQYGPGKYPTDPQAFLMVDGKLHLFYRAEGYDAREGWQAEGEAVKTRALANWAEMVPKP